jgi:hypothetical protein
VNEFEGAALWVGDQNDPDNWLTIPDFNVNPQDVNFEGFAFPIYNGESPDGGEFRGSARRMVSTLRAEARARFTSQQELNLVHFTAWKKASDEAPPSQYLPDISLRGWTNDEVFACRYFWILQNLKGCLKHFRRGKRLDLIDSLNFFAEAASLMADTLMNKPLSPESVRQILSSQASHAASRKNVDARRWVWSEWEKHGTAEYLGNKTEFCKTYVQLVANQYQNGSGEPLKISAKQMRDVWLSGAPGLPATGPGSE